MAKIKTKANDSRQSVDLKWKLRKGLEENIAFKEDGTMEVGHGIESDGNIIKGYAGIYYLPVDGAARDVVVFEGVDGGSPVFFTIFYSSGNGYMPALLTDSSGNTIHNPEQIKNSEVHTTREYCFAYKNEIPTEGLLAETFSKARFQHTVILSGDGFEFCFSAPSSKNLVVDSYQDLEAVFGRGIFALTGYSAALSAKPVFIDLRGGSAANVFIRVYDEAGGAFSTVSLASLGAVNYMDDVRIPK